MEQLIASQQELVGRMARTHENLRKVGAAKISVALVQTTMGLLEKKWDKFEEQHELLQSEHWEDLKTHEYWTTSVMTQVEDIYLQQKTALIELEQSLMDKKCQEEARKSVIEPVQSQVRSSLPRIQLPQFSGKYEDWPAFRDLFCSLITRESSLSNVEKLHYLKGSVKGNAELLIRNLPMTDDNFARAWTTLSHHYENRRLLVRSYLTTFTSLPRMKSESVSDLRKVFHGVINTVGSLEGIGRPIERCTDLFVHLVIDLMDPRTRREWENSLGGTTDPPTYEELRKFLENKLQTLEALSSGKSDHCVTRMEQSNRVSPTLHTRTYDARGNRCPLCAKNHFVLYCDKYKSRSAQERREAILKHNLCVNCLGKHRVSECKSAKSCVQCDQRHHSTVHDAFYQGEASALATCATAHMSQRASGERKTVLLATARIKVTDRFGAYQEARALIDPGSEASLIAESLVQRLRVSRASSAVTIVGIGGRRAGVTRGQVSVAISSRFGALVTDVTALILPHLTLYGDKCHGVEKSWSHLKDLDLADPEYTRKDPVEIILGADIFALIVRDGLRKGRPGEPIAQCTELGWLVSGTIESSESVVASLQYSIDDELSIVVRRFWEQEELPRDSLPVSPDEKRCLDHFASTHTRQPDGKYIVRLPIVNPLPDLSRTRDVAAKMLETLENRFRRNHSFRDSYDDFMKEYEKLGHMSRIVSSSRLEKPRMCFLPHHGMFKSGTNGITRLRVVFNGSQEIRSGHSLKGHSLNAHLLTGPNLLPRLDDILLRWRRHRYVYVTDVEKMYRQILVNEQDRSLQQILWRREGVIQEFQLNTVTYGLACAPFLAIRTLQQLAVDEEARFPLSAAVLSNDVYVDDILTGASTLPETIEMRRQLQDICTAGGFPLKKWAANNKELLSGISNEHQAVNASFAWCSQESHSTLGLRWRPSDDTFMYEIRSFKEGPITKRLVLSQASQLYDPLGWISPVTVRAKCIIQSTWLKEIGWDDDLPNEDATSWKSLRNELHLLRDLRVPRWVGVHSSGDSIELHGFSDASEQAYAAVLYSRTVKDGIAHVSLLRSKTRVAPLKQLSLPRLELCAASLLVSLTHHTLNSLYVAVSAVHLWTDSTVTLGWIQGHPRRWTTFVANRMSEIQRILPQAMWHHVTSKDNPADCASRGMAPSALLTHALWWQGPSFLITQQWPPVVTCDRQETLPERRKIVLLTEIAREESELLTRHSSMIRLLRVSGWVRRWHPRWKVAPTEQPLSLTPDELRREENFWVSHAQAVKYAKEITSLENDRPLPRCSPLLKLTPFKDGEGLLRVGGRLKNTVLSYDERHPIILPPESHFTKLVVEALHLRSLHGGVQSTLGLIRQRHWIPRGRQLVRQHIHRCAPCVRWRAASPQPFMGNLPGARVVPCRPFKKTGVDYAGPILLFDTAMLRGRVRVRVSNELTLM